VALAGIATSTGFPPSELETNVILGLPSWALSSFPAKGSAHTAGTALITKSASAINAPSRKHNDDWILRPNGRAKARPRALNENILASNISNFEPGRQKGSTRTATLPIVSILREERTKTMLQALNKVTSTALLAMMHYLSRPHHKVLFDKSDELVIKKPNFA
jgi:hypothetical protein